MEINVLNNTYSKIAVVDNYTSLMWCKRYYGIGALDLEIEATPETLAIFKQHYFIMRDDDDTIFRIEARELDTDENGNDILIIGAVDCKSILNQRIIWEQINWGGGGTVENFIRQIITRNLIADSTSGRRIINFELKAAHGYTETIEQQVTYDRVGDKVTELCQAFGYGWKITYEQNKFKFDLFKGVDRSIDQDENVKLIFSPEYENLISSKYNEDMTEFRNVALVGGEGEGTDRKKRTIGTASGLDRYEMFVDASGISTNSGEIDLVDYYNLLIAEGKEKLAEQAVTKSFEGEVETNNYKYKTDYNLGDIVTVRNQYGIAANARITEIIETWDDNGYSVDPKFEYFEPIVDEPEIEGALLTENGLMMMTESATPLLVESAPEGSEGVKISELEPVDELFDGSCFPIVQNGVTKKVTKATLEEDLAIPTKTSELTNDSGFLTSTTGVTGVKGNSESTYRTGNVNITKANVGLGNVTNVATESTITSGSNNNITSGAVYNELRKICSSIPALPLYYEISITQTYFDVAFIRTAILNNISKFGNACIVKITNKSNQSAIIWLDKASNTYFGYDLHSVYCNERVKYTNGSWSNI